MPKTDDTLNTPEVAPGMPTKQRNNRAQVNPCPKPHIHEELNKSQESAATASFSLLLHKGFLPLPLFCNSATIASSICIRDNNMLSDDTLWDLEPHTEAKHDILRRYLSAWFPIMANYIASSGVKRLIYIDGFAGPGKYRKGEDGSPIIALNTLLQHTLWHNKLAKFNYTFLFIERDQQKEAHLRQICSGMSVPDNINLQILPGEFEPTLIELLKSLESSGKNLAPAFVFIDPFGPTGFSMNLVHRILQYRTRELLITLNLRALNRWFLPVVERHKQVDTLYATEEWRGCFNIVEPQRKEEFLRNLYRKQLEGQIQKVYVKEFRMVNIHNQTANYLFYATHHPKGLAVMKQAMWKVDPSGAFIYSDVTNPNQLFLFGAEFDREHAENYSRELARNYAGQTVTKGQLDKITDEHEHYLGRHLTRALDLLVSGRVVIPSSAKRGEGWSRETIFRFPPAVS